MQQKLTATWYVRLSVNGQKPSPGPKNVTTNSSSSSENLTEDSRLSEHILDSYFF